MEARGVHRGWPTISSTSGISRSAAAPWPTGARTPARRASLRRTPRAPWVAQVRPVHRRSRSWASGGSRAPTRWSTSSATASSTSSALRGRRSPTRSCRKDRGGTARRHPRVHRLQHLHLTPRAGDDRSSARRTRRSARSTGVGGTRSGSTAARNAGSRRADRRRRAGRPRVRRRAWQARHAARSPRRRRRVSSAATSTGSRGFPASASGSASSSWRRSQLEQAAERRVHPDDGALAPTDVLEYGAELVVVATGSHWAGDGFGPAHHGPIPGADATLAARPHARADHGGAKPVPGEPGRRLRLRRLLRRCEHGGEARTRRSPRRLVTSRDTVAPYMHYTLEAPRMLALLTELGVEFVHASRRHCDRHGVVRAATRLCAGPHRRMGGGRGRPRDAASIERRSPPGAHGRPRPAR